MRVDQLPDLHTLTFELRPSLQGTPLDELQLRRELQLFPQDEAGGELLLVQGEQRLLVRGATPPQQVQLRDLLGSGAPRVVWLLRVTKEHLLIQIHRFRSGIWLDEALSLVIDDLVLGEIGRRFKVGGTPTDLHRWLLEQIQIEDDEQGRARLVVQVGDDGSAFRLLGHRISLDIRRSEDQLKVQRVIAGVGSGGPQPQLLFSRLSMIDASAGSGLTEAARLQLEQALRSGDSYLELWRRYQQLDEQLVARQAQAFGVVPYEQVQERQNVVRFMLSDPEAAEASLVLLDAPGLCLEATTEANLQVFSTDAAPPSSRKPPTFVAHVRRVTYDGSAIDVEAPEEGPAPPPKGYLRLSVRGDEVRLRRRQAAEQRLRSGNLPLPHLGLLLEGKPGGSPRYARRQPDSKVLREALNKPTERQIEAISVAINTPDIALIQGPPGTGKTAVITALQRCLAALAERDGERHHRILVTSTQHEAVDNVVARTDIFGIPPVKVGKRRRQNEGVDGVERWRQDRIQKIRGKSPEEPEPEILLRARRLAVRCLATPGNTTSAAQADLTELERLVSGRISPARGEKLRAIVHRLARPQTTPEVELRELQLRCARGLRLDPVAFRDDGPLQAASALLRLEGLLSPEETSFLRRCAAWTSPEAPPWLSTDGPGLVEPLRERLAGLTSPTIARGLLPEEQQAVREILEEMARDYRQGKGGEQAVVVDYLDDLEHDPEGLRQALMHYTVALAATCQQAASRQMLQALELSEGSVSFETVIVDEAARSHPLDLFIPMTMARRRIVLVGDHRQLPHMLEPEVERAFDQGQKNGPDEQPAVGQAEPLRQSLFARLWSLLKRLEEQDGVRRTVTLDTQFRMHPTLGRYLSEQFYDSPDLSDRVPLRSALSAEVFAHRLPRYQRGGRPCCAAWVDVPGGPGREEHSGRSKTRPVEARRVAEEVKRLLEESPDLTVGVIAFYSAQVQLIFEELVRLGVAERMEQGEFRIREAYRHTSDAAGLPTERLRVGTVDAFQGKEFDVVLLSMTRSNSLPEKGPEGLRRKYGHLLLANRLCVAMSRQRRLLIVFGDLRFVKRADPLLHLQAFLSLCEGPDGLLF